MIFTRKRLIPITLLSTIGLSIWYKIYSQNVTSQKQSSSLFKGLIYHLNHQNTLPFKQFTHSNGDEIHGLLNNVQGIADISFKGETDDKNGAMVFFKGKKINGDIWEAMDFRVVFDDKEYRC